MRMIKNYDHMFETIHHKQSTNNLFQKSEIPSLIMAFDVPKWNKMLHFNKVVIDFLLLLGRTTSFTHFEM